MRKMLCGSEENLLGGGSLMRRLIKTTRYLDFICEPTVKPARVLESGAWHISSRRLFLTAILGIVIGRTSAHRCGFPIRLTSSFPSMQKLDTTAQFFTASPLGRMKRSRLSKAPRLLETTSTLGRGQSLLGRFALVTEQRSGRVRLLARASLLE